MPDRLSARDLAEQYGFAYAMIKSNQELYRLFKKAVSQTWDQNRIMTEVRATKWYRTHSESERNASALKASDPETYKQGRAAARVRVQMMASEYGARISEVKLRELTTYAYSGGWDDNQIRQVLGRYVRYVDGRLFGQAGAMESEWRNYAGQMGVTLAQSQVETWAQRVISGDFTPQDALGHIKEMAKNKYTALASRIDQGETIESIAAPYIQSYAKILEYNPEAVNIQNSPLIEEALQARRPDGTVQAKSIYEFERDLRRSDQWKNTDNAQDQFMEVGHKILQDFGLST